MFYLEHTHHEYALIKTFKNYKLRKSPHHYGLLSHNDAGKSFVKVFLATRETSISFPYFVSVVESYHIVGFMDYLLLSSPPSNAQ